jgi:TP901 family phage tail tape measure protein
MSKFVLTAQLQLQAPSNVKQVVQQIQSQLQGVSVNVQVQGSPQVQKQLQQVTQQANQATTAAERMGKAFALSIRRFAAFSIATRAVGLFTSTLNDAVQSSIDFERQLIKVSQVTGKSIGQLRGLTKQITDLSTGFGVASSDLLEVSTVLAQAGLSAEDTSVALKTLAKAALAPNFDSISETAEGAIAILAQFQQGVGALEQQLGSINAVAGAFAVEASDLIDVVRRTGGVFKSSGGSLNELLALFTSVRATTRESAESIGTGLRTIFTRIQRPKTIEFLKQFGVELVDLNGKFVGPYEAIKRLSEALSGLGEGDLTFISIAEELGGFRQIGKVLPLLQQFSTAQSALNVAMKAGDSLTKDAASAQAALAIRIMKVKEEFLGLIRSVTETSTFQIMANTALSLASALIKIGDAIKPLLPMLAALAAVKLVKGMGGFLGGMMSGATSGRAYNKGGKVLGFARGGLVPGSGNGDTVPAMLAPGEFVIRKSSVNKMGAGNLAAMNENRYAIGGKVGGISLTPIDAKESGQGNVSIGNIIKSLLTNSNLPGGISGNKKVFEGTKSSQEAQKIIQKVGGFSGSSPSTSRSFIAEGYGFPSGKAQTQLQDNLNNSLSDLITGAAKELGSSIGIQSTSAVSPQIIKSIGTADILGKVFEGSLNLLGAPFDSLQAKQDRDAFDFPSGLGPQLGSYFTALGSIPTDAKKNLDKRILDDIASRKVQNFIAGQVNTDPLFQTLKTSKLNQSLSNTKTTKKFFGGPISKFAAGGGVGTDTVPALLTPGEFVVNRSSAQRIGYGNLNRMNKVGKYANGGVVRHFATGGGVKAGGSGISTPGIELADPSLLTRSMSVLSSAFTSTAKILAQGDKALMSVDNQSYALANALIANAKANDYTVAQTTELYKAYDKVVQVMLRMGYSDDAILDKTQELASALDADTKAKKASAAATTAATSAASATSSPTASTASSAVATAATAAMTNKAGGAVTSSNVKASVSGLADNGEIQREIATTAQEIKKTGSYSKVLSTSLEKQSKITNDLYQESAALDAKISAYDQALAKLAAQQGKAAATGTAANRIVQMKMDAESKRIEVDQKALAEEQKLQGIQKKHQATIEKQTQLMDKQNALIQQAKTNKQAATQLTQQTLKGGTASNFKDADQKLEREAAYAKVRANKDKFSRGSLGGGMMPKDIGGAAIAISMVTASLQAMLPPLDENSSALTKMSHSFLGLITTVAGVAFALQSFGVNLKAQSVMKFLGGGGISQRGLASMRGGMMDMGLSRGFATQITGIANSFAKMAGPLALVVGGLWVASKVTTAFVDAMFGNAEKAKQAAIQKGDIGEAGKQAKIASGRDTKNAGIYGTAAAGAGIGAAIGTFIFPAVGSLIGAASGALVGGFVGLIAQMTDPGERFAQEAANTAMAMAANTKASNDLNYAQTQAALAAEKFKNGAISASEYLDTFNQAGKSVQESRKYTDAVVKQSTEGKSEIGSGAILRNLGAYLGGGLFGMETAATRNTRLTQEGTDAVKGQRENEAKLFDSSTEARNAAIRSTIARGGSVEDAQALIKNKTGLESEDMRRRASSLGFKAEKARSSGDIKLAAELDTQSKQLFAQANQLEDSFVNIAKEVQRAKDSFNAMNLGLRSATATASALSASMDHFSAGLEVGGSSFVNDVEFLQQAMSSSAQAMDPAEIKSAVKGVSDNLRQFGSSEEYIKKFEGNVAAFTQAQGNYNKAFDNIKKSMADKDFKNLSPDDLKKKFAEELTNGMGDDVSDEAKKNLKAVINGMELDTGDVDKIMAGDLSVFGDKLSEAQKKMLEDVQKIAQERAKAEQVLIDFTKKRIDAERNLVQAQQEALDLTLEGREIQGKYGGAAVTNEERKQNLLAKSNVESNRLGLTAMRTGDVGDLRRRNAEIKGSFAAIEARRSQQNGMQGKAGVIADEEQKDLQKAYKTQIETIRGLIKLEEEQLKITQEKNKLEKESMESLIKGDVEEFFKKQSAVGATAAIASGDTRLQNLYGADALGMAYQDIQRQQDAGVQTLYGQQLAGPGGLTEAAAGAALSARGITDAGAAQVLAGTTAEEEASKARLRELGGTLGETGQLGADMAEMQVQTATINVNSAQLKFDEVMKRGNEKAQEAQNIENKKASGMFRGGPVYASRGIFVPRGTDTIPAMLTPGEFVVNRAAVQRGNNLQMLQAMNNGSGGVSSDSGAALMARGGMVRYRGDGSENKEAPVSGGGSGGMFENMSKFVTAISNFNSDLSSNIDKLGNTKISIKLDSTSVNINLNDGGLLKSLTSQVKQEIFDLVKNRLVAGEGGRLRENSGVLT